MLIFHSQQSLGGLVPLQPGRCQRCPNSRGPDSSHIFNERRRSHSQAIRSHSQRGHLAKRQKPHSVLVRSAQDEELERAIQQGLDDQDLRAATLKLRAEEFGQSNDELEELASGVAEALGGTCIYLVGMMGSGKSTVGKLVADAIDYPFLDSDELVEEYADSSIAEIFKDEGEEAFRELESTVLQELMPFKACVISTGGGVVERRKNWGYMQHGIVVWLNGQPELLARRACQDDQNDRPLLEHAEQDASEEERLQATTAKLTEILDRRRGQYAQADIQVSLAADDGDLSGASLSQVANRLLEAVNTRLQTDKGAKDKKAPNREFKGFGPSH